MKIEITVKRHHAFLFSGALVLFSLVLFANAFGTNNPAVFGHSGGEIDVAGLSGSAPSLTAGAATNANFATTAGSASGVSCTDCLGSGQIAEGSFNWPTANDLSCTNCIGGTEIDESSLGTVTFATFAALCQNVGSSSNADICLDIPGGNVCSKDSCADGTCDGCVAPGPFDLILTCSSGRIERLNRVSAAAC